MARPNKNLTLDFIREYQSGKISPETFYAVMQVMLGSDDPAFHSLAVYAAAETPSPRSYGVLTSVVLGGSFGPAATASALTEVKTYEFIQLIWIPQSVLSKGTDGSDSAVQLTALAANAIERSTFRYLGSGEETDPSALPRSVGPLFQTMIPTLERALNQYQGQSSITTPVQTALDRIRQSNLVASSNVQ